MTERNVTVYFDFETAGLAFDAPDIQIAAVAVDDETWEELATFEAKMLFDVAKAEPDALAINHYTPEAWAAAKEPRAVAYQFNQFLSEHACIKKHSVAKKKDYYVSRLCGHFASQFDGQRLKAMFERHNQFLSADYLVKDTVQQALFWFSDRRLPQPESYKLTALCRYFGIPVDVAHEALADVRLTIALSKAMMSTR